MKQPAIDTSRQSAQQEARFDLLLRRAERFQKARKRWAQGKALEPSGVKGSQRRLRIA
jgi:hypothetical protein